MKTRPRFFFIAAREHSPSPPGDTIEAGTNKPPATRGKQGSTDDETHGQDEQPPDDKRDPQQMTRLYKQTARGTGADETDKQAGSRPVADDLLYKLDIQRQVSQGSERTFGQWAIQALLDDKDEDGIAPEASKQDERHETTGQPAPPRRRVFIVSANDEYNFCAWCGHRIPGTARVRHDKASNTTIIECPHCRRELEYVLR